MKSPILLIVFVSFLSTNPLFAQNTRLKSYNAIGWYNYFGTFKLSEKYSLHTEYQFRRTDFVKNWQQGLLRVGVNYQLNPKVQLRVGYAWAETYAYGDIPLNRFGKTFTEHRLFQMATVVDKVGIVDLSHRFMLEQRWVGRYSTANLSTEDEFPFSNRLRYMFRTQIPLRGTSVGNKTPYLAFYDEIFIGFGENVGENIFDQNRIGVLLGYNWSKKARFEIGYLSQTLQLGREINNQNVFQFNNGLIANMIFNIDVSKK